MQHPRPPLQTRYIATPILYPLFLKSGSAPETAISVFTDSLGFVHARALRRAIVGFGFQIILSTSAASNGMIDGKPRPNARRQLGLPLCPVPGHNRRL